MVEQLGKFNKDLGSPLGTAPGDLTQTNADGKSVIPLTQEQKYLFDKNGWLLFPGVLTESEIKEMRDFCYRLKHDPETIPQHHRSTYGGPLEKLTDHPVVVAFGNEFLASSYLASDTCYGFRMEMSFLALRSTTDETPFKFHAHNGNGMLRLPGDCHQYSCLPGQAYSGLTRVVWELNPVEKGTAAQCSLQEATRRLILHQKGRIHKIGSSGIPIPVQLDLSSSLQRQLHIADSRGKILIPTESLFSTLTTPWISDGVSQSHHKRNLTKCHRNARRFFGMPM